MPSIRARHPVTLEYYAMALRHFHFFGSIRLVLSRIMAANASRPDTMPQSCTLRAWGPYSLRAVTVPLPPAARNYTHWLRVRFIQANRYKGQYLRCQVWGLSQAVPRIGGVGAHPIRRHGVTIVRLPIDRNRTRQCEGCHNSSDADMIALWR